MIRMATTDDLSRIAEIRVFVNRVQFWPIFQDAGYSFGELQVVPVAEHYRDSVDRGCVYVCDDDGIVKGFAHVEGQEVVTLYVDHFFQNQGVGSALLEYAMAHTPVTFLWALELNVGAIRFYERHGFRRSGERRLEEGTTEYLVKMTARQVQD